MGRRSIAEKLYETHKDKEKGESTWLVVYDFTRSRPPTRFWDNLKRLQEMTGEGTLVQYSVFLTHDMRGTVVAGLLARHYGAQILFFRAEEARVPWT